MKIRPRKLFKQCIKPCLHFYIFYSLFGVPDLIKIYNMIYSIWENINEYKDCREIKFLRNVILECFIPRIIIFMDSWVIMQAQIGLSRHV